VLAELGLCDEGWETGPAPSTAPVLAGAWRTARLLWKAHSNKFGRVVDVFPQPQTILARLLALPDGPIGRDKGLIGALLGPRHRSRPQDASERAAALLGVGKPTRSFRIHTKPEADAWVEKLLMSSGSRGSEPVVLVYCAGNWPVAKAVSLAERLRADVGVRIAFVDTPRESGAAREMAASLGGPVIGITAPAADRFLAFVARASLVITDDRGVAYLAGICSTATLYLTVPGAGLPALEGRRELQASVIDSIAVADALLVASRLVTRERSGPLFL
jgi:ADP-heptose:LPS heptosyltransferase